MRLAHQGAERGGKALGRVRHGDATLAALVAPGKVVGEGELWVGNPARPARTLSDKEIESLHYSADHYVRLKDEYLG